MKLSTAVELIGFGCLSAAAFLWQTTMLEVITGLGVTGLLLLLVGYATDDQQAVVAVTRLIQPLKVRRARRRMVKQSKAHKAA